LGLYARSSLKLTKARSINSIDELLASDDFNEQAPEVQKQELVDRIAELCERKGSSYKGREDCLTSYIRILTAHHLADELYGRVADLVPALMRSIKVESTEREAVLALKAIALTIVSFQDDVSYDGVATQLKRTISDSQSLPTKAAAIHCLGICIAFCGAGEEEISEVLNFLLEIASSDGSFVGATDDADTVIAALQEYGFLATYIEDLEAESEDAAATFVDQLDSEDVHVQIAAGENVALLYERSYTPMEEDETASDLEETEDNSSSGDDSGNSDGPKLIKRYNAYHNTYEVLEKVQSLASLSTRKLNKHDKRKLHQSFASVQITVENPRLGLQTNNASKMTVRIHQEGEMKVDKWWKMMRLNALRRLLQGGFVNHYFEGNKQVLDTLPLIMRDVRIKGGMRSPGHDKGRKGRWKDSPKRSIRGFSEDE
jgi:Interferon-related developmental regulator (IFRD)